jgi:uridylate kinase
MKVVLSIGGSSIIPEGKPDLGYLKTLSGLIGRSRNSFGILCGGGTVARLYANAARELGAGEYEADSIAIRSTRQNAHLLLTALKAAGVEAHPQVLDDFELAKSAARECRAVVMGGTIPGITTDTDSVLLAEAIGAGRLVNVSNVDAIYDSDPRKNKAAKRFARMTYEELISLASSSDKRVAGTNFVFDLLACKLIARSKIETHFVSYRKMDDLAAAIEGRKHGGTVVG